MRRSLWIAGLLAVAALVVFGLSRSRAQDGSAPDGTESSASSPEGPGPQPAPPVELPPVEWVKPPPGESAPAAAADSTLPVEVPAQASDGSVEVHVTAAGKPVSGAAIRIYLRPDTDNSTGRVPWRIAGTRLTDREGKASLFARPGRYLVAARADGFAPARVQVTRPSGEQVTRVELALGTAYTLQGRTVEKGSTEPVPLAELLLTPTSERPSSWRRASAPAEEQVVASSDARGAFAVRGLSEGTWQVEVMAPGHATLVRRDLRVPSAGELLLELQGAGTLEGFVTKADGSPAADATVTAVGGPEPVSGRCGQGGGFSLEVTPGAWQLSARLGSESGALERPVPVAAGQTARELRITLGESASIQGTITAKTGGKPIEGALVAASPYTKLGDSGRALTDAKGHYALSGLAPGAYDLDIHAQGYSSDVLRGVTVLQGQTFTADDALEGTGAVSGVVKDGTGRPVEGAIVTAGRRFGGDDGSFTTRTGADGRFLLDGLELGETAITARREGALNGAQELVQIEEGKAQELELTLQDTGELVGRVTGPGGKPLQVAASVRLVRRADRPGPDDLLTAPVGADGRYQVQVTAGSYLAQALASGERRPPFGLGGVPVQVEAGQTVTRDLELAGEPDLLVSGRVVEPGGAPSPGAAVMFFVDGRPMMGWGTPDGEFTFQRPPSVVEPKTVGVRAINGGRLGRVDNLQPGARDVVVELQPSASVRGRVLGGSLPVDGFTLSWSLVEDGPGLPRWDSPQQFTGDAFSLGDVPAAKIALVAQSRDGRRGRAEVTPSPGGVVTQDITLEPAGRISGTVVDAATRQALADVFLQIDKVSNPTAEYRTDARGAFQLDVAAGPHLIEAMSPLGHAEKKFTAVSGKPLELGRLLLQPWPLEPGTIGAQFVDVERRVSTAGVLRKSPAERAGLRLGDELVSIDGLAVTSALDARTRTRGAPGTPVQLEVQRGAAKAKVLLTVIRAK